MPFNTGLCRTTKSKTRVIALNFCVFQLKTPKEIGYSVLIKKKKMLLCLEQTAKQPNHVIVYVLLHITVFSRIQCDNS